MIISCEKCATKYNVNAAFIGLDGRKVKCTACKNIWLVRLPEEEKQQLNNEKFNINSAFSIEKNDIAYNKIEDSTNTLNVAHTDKSLKNLLPVIISRQVPIWLKVLPISILFLNIMIFGIFYYSQILSFVPKTAHIYKHFGIYNTEGLILQDIALHKLSNDSEYFDILVKGRIVNRSLVEKHMPGLRLSILDQYGKNIISNISNSGDTSLAPGEEFIINNKITNLNGKAKYIAIDIGNKIELFLR